MSLNLSYISTFEYVELKKHHHCHQFIKYWNGDRPSGLSGISCLNIECGFNIVDFWIELTVSNNYSGRPVYTYIQNLLEYCKLFHLEMNWTKNVRRRIGFYFAVWTSSLLLLKLACGQTWNFFFCKMPIVKKNQTGNDLCGLAMDILM